MSDTSAPTHAPRIEGPSFGARLSAVMPYLLVPLLIASGYLAIWLQASWPVFVPFDPAAPSRSLTFSFAPLDTRFSSWLTLTVSGLAMGMMIFIMASGLTLVFGLMDVINFGHGAFVSVGAFVGVTVLLMYPEMATAPDLVLNLQLVAIAIAAAMGATALMGFLFERVIVRPVYGAHLKQILVTMGGLIIVEQLIHVVWGPEEIFITRPEMLKGAITWGGAALETYRLMAVGIGLAVFLIMRLVLRHSRIGLIVRAGVQNGEMVQAMGYRLRLVFIAVFMVGSALAGLGGVMWGLYQEVVTAAMGGHIMVLVFIVVIIGGLGSVEGCFIGALLVGLLQNYIAFLEPKAALISNIGLMVLILMWRPEGMMPVARAR